jgi:hypothetical protein
MEDHEESLEVGIAAGLDVLTATVIAERDDKPLKNCGQMIVLVAAGIASERTGLLLCLHHHVKLFRAHKQPIWMAGQFAEVPSRVKCLGSVVDAIDDHGDKRERLAGFPAISQGLRQERSA